MTFGVRILTAAKATLVPNAANDKWNKSHGPQTTIGRMGKQERQQGRAWDGEEDCTQLACWELFLLSSGEKNGATRARNPELVPRLHKPPVAFPLRCWRLAAAVPGPWQ